MKLNIKRPAQDGKIVRYCEVKKRCWRCWWWKKIYSTGRMDVLYTKFHYCQKSKSLVEWKDRMPSKELHWCAWPYSLHKRFKNIQLTKRFGDTAPRRQRSDHDLLLQSWLGKELCSLGLDLRFFHTVQFRLRAEAFSRDPKFWRITNDKTRCFLVDHAILGCDITRGRSRISWRWASRIFHLCSSNP